jgi:hypothetical protein
MLQASGVHNPITTEAECRAGIAAVEACAARMDSARTEVSHLLHYAMLYIYIKCDCTMISHTSYCAAASLCTAAIHWPLRDNAVQHQLIVFQSEVLAFVAVLLYWISIVVVSSAIHEHCSQHFRAYDTACSVVAYTCSFLRAIFTVCSVLTAHYCYAILPQLLLSILCCV